MVFVAVTVIGRRAGLVRGRREGQRARGRRVGADRRIRVRQQRRVARRGRDRVERAGAVADVEREGQRRVLVRRLVGDVLDRRVGLERRRCPRSASCRRPPRRGCARSRRRADRSYAGRRARCRPRRAPGCPRAARASSVGPPLLASGPSRGSIGLPDVPTWLPFAPWVTPVIPVSTPIRLDADALSSAPDDVVGRRAGAWPDEVARDDGVAQRERARQHVSPPPEPAPRVVGAVVRDRAVRDRGLDAGVGRAAGVDTAAVAGRRVAADGGVDDRHGAVPPAIPCVKMPPPKLAVLPLTVLLTRVRLAAAPIPSLQIAAAGGRAVAAEGARDGPSACRDRCGCRRRNRNRRADRWRSSDPRSSR